jgi:hypothetical protein
MIELARAFLVTVVLIWSTSRQDVALHLIGWVVIGSGVAAFTRELWLEYFSFAVDIAKAISAEVLDILPESAVVVSLFSFAICGMAALFLAGSEQKNQGAPVPGAWTFFALSRTIFPLSGCGIDLATDPAISSLFLLFTLLSLVGPLSSWPSRSFALSDAIYALTVDRTGQECAGTEAALVATCLVIAHDLVHTKLLIFMENVAFATAMVFIAETSISVLFMRSLSHEGNWNDALDVFGAGDLQSFLLKKAPPALLTSWAVGVCLRTFTQGRLSATELITCIALGLLLGLAVLHRSPDPLGLLQKPSFACAVSVVSAACTSQLAQGRRRVLRRNQYIMATGFFPSMIISDLPSDSSVEMGFGQEETDSISSLIRQVSEQSMQSVGQYDDADPFPISMNEVTIRSPVVKTEKQQVVPGSYSKIINAMEKRRFFLEAFLKGSVDEEKKSELEQLKKSIAGLKEKVSLEGK